MKNKNGFSLLEVTIAVSLLAGVLYGIMPLFNNQARDQKALEMKLFTQSLETTLKSFLNNDPQFCSLLLQGTSVDISARTASLLVTRIPRGIVQGSTPLQFSPVNLIPPVGTKMSNFDLTPTGYTLDSITYMPSGTYNGDLKISFNSPSLKRNFSISVTLLLTLDVNNIAAFKPVLSCQATNNTVTFVRGFCNPSEIYATTANSSTLPNPTNAIPYDVPPFWSPVKLIMDSTTTGPLTNTSTPTFTETVREISYCYLPPATNALALCKDFPLLQPRIKTFVANSTQKFTSTIVPSTIQNYSIYQISNLRAVSFCFIPQRSNANSVPFQDQVVGAIDGIAGLGTVTPSSQNPLDAYNMTSYTPTVIASPTTLPNRTSFQYIRFSSK